MHLTFVADLETITKLAPTHF